ncbi:mannitol dehydrogenase family protein [Thermostaphylospora chromogena]|uniref:Mannitol-1-phosphate 5-dehydrogenase n=1 Tax=Thermostaphylospora chromogena TaxID=35622 RepID=A0A1H1HSX3_9ACTN|nr:mannitol dehydrogenase family protein [Thermostaphylospora chromogena]SDR28258.1 fructuronate reductase [Thermostaphylospora chromogena]
MSPVDLNSADRLTLRELPRLRSAAEVRTPAIDPAELSVGIVHLGLGGFHRAHQAIYLEDAAEATGDTRWGVCGVSQRSADAVRRLRPQDGLYTVLERGAGGLSARVVGTVREAIFAGDEPDALRDRIAAEEVRIITVTVTEKGHRRGPDGGLDLDDPVVRADLAGEAPPRSAIGRLVRGLQARRAASGAPITVMSCDNLIAGGAVLRRLVLDFAAALPAREGEPLIEWITGAVRFPSSVVDRIVPAATDADRGDAARLLGVRDEAAVATEPFRQWVVEDDFAADRPRLEEVGVIFTADVAPYEAVKLRLLNASHSLLAYLGALAGYETIAEAVGDPTLAEAAEGLIFEDAAPAITAPPGIDLTEYGRTVLTRFANPALPDRTTRVAMDGSQKLPLRLLGTVRERLAAGASPRWATLAVAGWMAYVALGRDAKGRPLPLDDPLADRLREAAAGVTEPRALVDRLLAVEAIFGADLREDDRFRALLVDHLSSLLRRGGAG